MKAEIIYRCAGTGPSGWTARTVSAVATNGTQCGWFTYFQHIALLSSTGRRTLASAWLAVCGIDMPLPVAGIGATVRKVATMNASATWESSLHMDVPGRLANTAHLASRFGELVEAGSKVPHPSGHRRSIYAVSLCSFLTPVWWQKEQDVDG